MKIIFSIVLLCITAISPVQAQIKTFDIKYLGEQWWNGIWNLHRISPTRILAQTNSMVAFNNDGAVERTLCCLPSLISYHFDVHSNTVVYLASEAIRPDPKLPATRQLRLIFLDSNLVEKSNTILDSTVTGFPTQFEYNTSFRTTTLLDSSILLISTAITTVKGKEQMVLHLSRDGRVIDRTSILDTNKSSTTSYGFLFQMQSGKLLFKKTTRYSPMSVASNLVTTDTAFHFSESLVDSADFSPDSRSIIIPTRDGGMCLAYYCYLSNLKRYMAAVVKYDSTLKRQWRSYVPGTDETPGYGLYLTESRNGGYYIATKAYDTAEVNSYPKFKPFPECFEDIALSRIDTGGKVLYTALYGTERQRQVPYSMMEDIDGGIIISGNHELIPQNWCEVVSEGAPSEPGNWLFKVDSLGQPAKKILVTGVEEQSGDASGIRIYPSPASGMLTVAFERVGYFTNIEIIDIQGRVVYTSVLEEDGKQSHVEIDISGFASGSYYCRLRSASFSISRPFVIQK